MKKAAVIGAGVAGMATAIRLAKLGFQVDVYEANSYPGGKLTQIERNGYRFDAGPSLFTLPYLMDELAELAGDADLFEYEQLPVITKYFWEDGTVVNAHANVEEFATELQEQLNEPKANVLHYLKNSELLYNITAPLFLENSLHKIKTYTQNITLKTVANLHRLDALRSVHQANSSWFKQEKTVQLFNRYTTYNGSNPYQAPATLNIIPHLEHSLGAYFPKGGMHSITQTLVKLGTSLGVNYHYNSRITGIATKTQQVAGIEINGEMKAYDVVVSNGDMVNTYKHLLPQETAPKYLMEQPKSSSALIFYWGMNREYPELDVHNIFFSEHYEEEFEHIFQGKHPLDDPTVYVYISSKRERNDAPAGGENWFVMINVPNNTGQDWQAIQINARQNIIAKLERILGKPVANHITTEDHLDPVLIEQRTSSYLGALYGNSSNNMMAAFLRHANFSSAIKNLYFCGGSVHPGGGIPLCLLSAKITSGIIAEDHL